MRFSGASETILGKDVIRPDIAGNMGAYGAALIGIERYDGKTPSGIVSREGLDHFSMTNMHTRCGLCENNCQLTISRFNDGSRFIAGKPL